MYVCTSKKYFTPKKLITNSTVIKHFSIPVSKNKRNFIRIEFPEITQNFQKFILLNKYIATIDNYIEII